MGAIHQIYEQEMFYNWIGDGKRCVAFHEAGHAVAAWLIRLDVQVIAVMDEYGYVAGIPSPRGDASGKGENYLPLEEAGTVAAVTC